MAFSGFSSISPSCHSACTVFVIPIISRKQRNYTLEKKIQKAGENSAALSAENFLLLLFLIYNSYCIHTPFSSTVNPSGVTVLKKIQKAGENSAALSAENFLLLLFLIYNSYCIHTPFSSTVNPSGVTVF